MNIVDLIIEISNKANDLSIDCATRIAEIRKMIDPFFKEALHDKVEKDKQLEIFIRNTNMFSEMKFSPFPVDKFPEPDVKPTVQNIPPIELKNLKNPE